MFRNFFVLTIRNLLKNRSHTWTNIVGLSIAMTCSVTIFLWIKNERSYDNFHPKNKRIYRIYSLSPDGFKYDGTPSPLAPAMLDEIPELEQAVRIFNTPVFALRYGQNSFYAENGATADPEFFTMFNFPFKQGNPLTALSDPFNIVLSETMARRYFGKENPMGKQLEIEGQGFLTVTGVMYDFPPNSHIKLDYLIPHKFLEIVRLCGMEWGDPNFRTYLLYKHVPDQQKAEADINLAALKNNFPQVVDKKYDLHIDALEDIYLNYEIENRLGPQGDKRLVRIYGAVGLFILLIACINFMNLSLAGIRNRTKEIAVKKVTGASRMTLIFQFLGESFIITLISFNIAIVLIKIVSPSINSFINIPGSILLHIDCEIAGIFIAVVIVTTLMAGLYPALIISGNKPNAIFSGRMMVPGKYKTGKYLVMVQFAISIVLIVCTLTIGKQMNYIKYKPLGFEKENVIFIPIRENIGLKFNVVRHDLLKQPDISAVSAKDCLPYTQRNNTCAVIWKQDGVIKNTDCAFNMETTRVDDQYFGLIGAGIAEGRDFSYELGDSSKKVYIVNEEAVRKMGLRDPVGKEFALYGEWGTIVGVIKNTYFKSLDDNIKPQLFHLFSDMYREGYMGYVLIKTNGNNIAGVVEHIRKVWHTVNSITPFEYGFLDQEYDNLYKKHQRTSQVITFFSLLAIFISCLGIFGLSSMLAKHRTKEIGIRKSNGADTSAIMVLLGSSFTRWLTVSIIIAGPVAWYAMDKWLQNFAYHTSLSWWIFALAGLMAYIIALLTVSWQSWRVASRNPVEALRYE
jgi:putative ABC transport system permease protein